jgi:hypothetical protein
MLKDPVVTQLTSVQTPFRMSEPSEGRLVFADHLKVALSSFPSSQDPPCIQEPLTLGSSSLGQFTHCGNNLIRSNEWSSSYNGNT